MGYRHGQHDVAQEVTHVTTSRPLERVRLECDGEISFLFVTDTVGNNWSIGYDWARSLAIDLD